VLIVLLALSAYQKFYVVQKDSWKVIVFDIANLCISVFESVTKAV